MKYDVFLSSRAKKQFKRFDAHIRHKLRTELLELEEDPSEKGSLLQGLSPSNLCAGKVIIEWTFQRLFTLRRNVDCDS